MQDSQERTVVTEYYDTPSTSYSTRYPYNIYHFRSQALKQEMAWHWRRLQYTLLGSDSG